ncbi:MAG: metallophosphoesterase [Planctomycetota bacterium]|nr:metallophosphoesterase [Planctomycetota bacterium]
MPRAVLALSRVLVSALPCLAAASIAVAVPPQFQRNKDGAATDGQSVVQAPSPRREVIAIIPDRTTGRDWGLRYLAEAVDDFNREKPAAVFCVGDLVQGYSRDHEVVRRERDDFLEIVERLRMPFYPTPGNHDLVSGKRDSGDRSFADDYRARFGPLYYSVELDLASFVILNTEDGDGQISPGFSDAQLAWLDRTLQKLAMRGKPMILLFHRPLWDHKPTRWDERVQPILVRHGVDYVIAGHYHALQALPPRDGIPYLLLGTCGGAADQHPLAGQLQHTTYLVIDESGSIEPYHQIAGTTLPVDWITKEDQDRAYKLKGDKDAVTIRGALADPLGTPSEGSIEVVLSNPLDRPIEWSFSPARAPAPWLVDDRDPRGQPIERAWTSRTGIDTFNPNTTDLASPFQLEFPTEPVVVAPGERATVRVAVRADAQAAPPLPAPFDVIARYEDSKLRKVPILFRERVPLARRIDLGDSLAAAAEYPIAVWQWSEYDTAETNAQARFAQGASGAVLEVALMVPDVRISGDAKPRDTKSSLDDPLGDAVRLVLGEGAEAREYLVTLEGDGAEGPVAPRIRALAADGKTLVAIEAVAAVFTKSSAAWSLQLSVRADALPAGARLADLPVNLGVADNDETFHTQWRWLAPRDIPARLRIGG